MKKPKMPKTKSLTALKNYEKRLNDYIAAKKLREKLQAKSRQA
jgi:hypothetical protein